ncbi:MAG: curved DNA-binding protein CbpA [Marivirga sp.]|jgi:curved DNA-binding protein CbpA
MVNNYYEAIASLGTREGATQIEIKEAFWKLSKQYHPDIYKGDNGEAFQRINQAYQYLKRYPDTPSKQTFDSTHQQSYSASQEHHQTAREHRTERNKARARKEVHERAAYYATLFRKARVFVLFVLVLNSLLIIDYLLPNIERTSTIAFAANPDEHSQKPESNYLRVVFKDGQQFNFYEFEALSEVIKDNYFTYEKSIIFHQQMSLYDETRSTPMTSGYNVFKIFGFVILIQALALWRYWRYNNINAKMNDLVAMAFFTVIQLALLVLR